MGQTPRFLHSILKLPQRILTAALILAMTGMLIPATLAQSPLAPNQQPGPQEQQTPQPGFVDQNALNDLFVSLAQATDQSRANEIANTIWRIWFTPNQSDLAIRMRAATAARQQGNAPLSLAMLDTIVRDFPDYAEGWNQRATLFFLMGDMEASLADVEQVLAREPRHFGALSGQSMIYRQQGRNDLALNAIIKALTIHPFIAQRALLEELLEPATIV